MTQSDEQMLRSLRPPAPRSRPLGFLSVAAVTLFLVLAVGVDYLTYSIVAPLRDASGKAPEFSDYVEYRLGGWSRAEPVVEVPLPPRNYARDPIGSAEKLTFAGRMSAALPAAPDGWTRRAFAEPDFLHLWPGLQGCTQFSEAELRNLARLGGGRGCPEGWSGDGFVVYERGDDRIALQVRYLPMQVPGVSIEKALKSTDLSAFGLRNFVPYKEPRERRHYGSFGGFVFQSLPRSVTRDDGSIADRPTRLYARQSVADGVDIFVVANVADAQVKSVVQDIDFRFLKAMMARAD